jgi:CheY-like chemotaxis protein
LFAVIALYLFSDSIKNNLFPRLGGIKAFGIEATFINKELYESAKNYPLITEENRNQVVRRAERLTSILKGAQLLIVNDVPSQMRHVCRILRNLGVDIDIASSTQEAISLMKQVNYDVIVSDMKRNGLPKEGISFLEETVRLGINRPTIFSVGNHDPSMGVPAYAFGITNRIDYLLNLIFDVLEREKG